MIQEDALIPYQTSPIPEGPWIVFAPHPDDETFGMGGTIRLASQKGVKIQLVVLSDGGMAGNPGTRQNEALCAAKILGIDDIEFCSIPDRQLANFFLCCQPDTGSSIEREKKSPAYLRAFKNKILSIYNTIRPRTIFLPSFQEIHPDHRSTTQIIYSFLKKNIYKADIWFYEIVRQCEANRLIDITPVIDVKQQAIRCYKSQIQQNNYQQIVLAINIARTFSLGIEVEYAEAFWAIEGTGQDLMSHQIDIMRRYYPVYAISDQPLVSVVLRTKDRPQLLREALKSLALQTYKNIEAVVVNDGGIDVESIFQGFKGNFASSKYIFLPDSMGRAHAANAGFHAATGEWIGILDDDDLYLPDGIRILLKAGLKTGVWAVYGITDMIAENSDGTRQHLRRFDIPFDDLRLIFENYIPTNSLLFHKDLLIKLKGMDTDFIIYEDWDFIFRLSKITRLHFVNKPVGVYRNFGYSTASGDRDTYLHRDARALFFKKHWKDLGPESLTSFYDLTKQDAEARIYDKFFGIEENLGNILNESRLAQNRWEERWTRIYDKFFGIEENLGNILNESRLAQSRWEERWKSLKKITCYNLWKRLFRK